MDANGLRFWLLGEARHFPAVQHVALGRRVQPSCA